MGRIRYTAIITHKKLDKKTSIAGKKSRIKTSTLSKDKKRSFKSYNRQGRR
jgi:hypothetical protein|tara:strand:+ start:23 stop:175 length:153 start_codon:yes stop_codon:yes gene_type:complete